MDDYMAEEHLTLDEDLNEEIAQQEEMNLCEAFFLDGMDSEELPSERQARQKDPFFPNHF